MDVQRLDCRLMRRRRVRGCEGLRFLIVCVRDWDGKGFRVLVRVFMLK